MAASGGLNYRRCAASNATSGPHRHSSSRPGCAIPEGRDCPDARTCLASRSRPRLGYRPPPSVDVRNSAGPGAASDAQGLRPEPTRWNQKRCRSTRFLEPSNFNRRPHGGTLPTLLRRSLATRPHWRYPMEGISPRRKINARAKVFRQALAPARADEEPDRWAIPCR